MASGAFSALNRRTSRAPVNPLDKATIVSIFPLMIDEVKPTLQPGRWIIPPGTYEKPTAEVIGPSSWWREVDSGQPLLEIPTASILIADSIVRDYCVGLPCCDMGESMPGLFYVPGVFTSAQMVKDYKNLLDIAKRKQDIWFGGLIKEADVNWSRTNGNPLSVNGLMKMAAIALGIEDREWIKAYKNVSLVRCFACGTMKNPLYPVCPSCRAIDPNFKGDIKFALST